MPPGGSEEPHLVVVELGLERVAWIGSWGHLLEVLRHSSSGFAGTSPLGSPEEHRFAPCLKLQQGGVASLFLRSLRRAVKVGVPMEQPQA
jgi:hypothetical protein